MRMSSITYQVTVTQDCTTWRLDGQLHREDGPAIENANGRRFWFLKGQLVTEEQHQRRTQPAVELTVAEIEKLLGKRVKIVK